MATIPTPLRVALGLAATAIDEARKLPETLPQLPATAIGTAMQASLRVQQHIATYAARGDELLTALRGTSEQAPAWATFDDDATLGSDAGTADRAGGTGARAAFDLIEQAEAIVEEDLLPLDPAALGYAGEPTGAAASTEPAATATPPGRTAPAKKAPAKKAPAKKAPPTKVPPAKSSAPKAPAKKAAPTKAATRPASEPLERAAERAEPTDPPNPSVLAAEIVQARQAETSSDEA
ncbi:MAG TPA: hypothetical protein VHO01_03290 [Jatrophihabitans sp.]|nr:hypothetical protein [Jatrophihabitans sp.]